MSTADHPRRLRQLARRATGAYRLPPGRLTLLKHSLNTVFRLDTDPKAGPGERYVVRIHRTGYHSAEEIRSELAWISAVRRETTLHVPEPVLAPDGTAVVSIADDTVGMPRLCTVFRWIPGAVRHPPWPLARYDRLGRLLAELHLHSERYEPEPGFVRKRWDLYGLRGSAVGVDPTGVWPLWDRARRSLVERGFERFARATEALGTEPATFGLIHSDLFSENLLWSGRTLAAIDFDGCGWGYYLYDLAVPLSQVRRQPGYADAKAALLRGYREARPLPGDFARWLDAFICARFLVHCTWLTAHAHEPAVAPDAAHLINTKMALVAQLLDAGTAHGGAAGDR